MDNTYAVRTKLKVPSRPSNRPQPMRQDNSILPKTQLPVKETADVVHRALPTIPIMKYVSNKQSANMPLPKPLVNTISSVSGKQTSNSIIRSAAPRKILTELMIGELEHEPATHASSTKFTHKIVRHKRPLLKQVPLTVLLAVVLGTTGYVSYDSWQMNSRVRLAINNNSSTSAVLGAADEAKPTNNVVVDAMGDYTVSNDLPKAIYIDKINVAAKVLQMGINADGTIQSPNTASDVGWYSKSAKPGQGGVMLFGGYTDIEVPPSGVFSHLDSISEGDAIVIERGDGKKFNYKVSHIEILPLEEVDMSTLLTLYDNADQGVNLIAYTSDGNTLNRLIIYAVVSN